MDPRLGSPDQGFGLEDQNAIHQQQQQQAPAAGAPGRRRQYAVDQAQAYYNQEQTLSYNEPPPSVGGGGAQLFTPGLTQDGAPQTSFFPPGQAGAYVGGQPGLQPGMQYGQQPIAQAPYGGAQPQMGQLADQFSQMGMGSQFAGGQKPVSVQFIESK